ncbi:MAG: phosphate signaling complex protein PhoU [bacterium]|nr:phosphate signaling complex protein PhoU [bacterium]
MSHYEERLQQDLDEIQGRVDAIGSTVRKATKRAIAAFLTGDKDLASEIILGDRPVNREIRDIDRLCHVFVVRHLPSAGPLRFVSSVLRLDVELERIGDYAVTICREVIQLSEKPPGKLMSDIELISSQAIEVLEQALQAFKQGDSELAKETLETANQVRATFQKAYSDLMKAARKQKREVQDLFALLTVLASIGRVASQAKNICEQVIFANTGEVKGERFYRILFVDSHNDSLSQMAAAFARKAFPASGEYESAGWEPAEKVDMQCLHFLDRKNFSTRGLEPRPMPATLEELAEFHLVIGLEPGTRERFEEVPFRTVVLEWDIGGYTHDLDQERSQAMLKAAFKEIKHDMRELMETLRGDEAD